MFEKDTPLRTRVRAVVAIFVGAAVVLGVFLVQEQQLDQQQARIDALERNKAALEDALGAALTLSAGTSSLAQTVSEGSATVAETMAATATVAVTVTEQRNACLMQLRGAWVEDHARGGKDTPVQVQYVLTTQALRQCWNDLDRQTGRPELNADLLDLDRLLRLAREDLAGCEDELEGERKWNDPVPWNPCRGHEDQRGCLGGVQTPAPTDLQSCQADLADSERERTQCREALWAVREGLSDMKAAGSNPAIVPNTWEAETE